MSRSDEEIFAGHQSLHEKLADLLEAKVLAGEIASGEVLPSEREMAEHYHLSRTVVRDAIRILMARGLVDVRQGVGTIVTRDQRKSFAQSFRLLLQRGNYSKVDIVEVRRILEVEIAALAAERLTEAMQSELGRILERYQVAMETDDEEAASEAHKQFHASLLRATGNQVFIDFLDPFVVFSVPPELSPEEPEAGTSQDEIRWADFYRHREIFEAVRARDPERARSAMREHMRLPEERARREMEEEQR